MAETTTELLEAIKSNSFLPTSQATFEDADILRLATDQLRGVLVPVLKQARLTFFLYTKDFAVDDETLSFAIPPKAIGATVARIDLVRDSDGSLIEVPLVYEGSPLSYKRVGRPSGEATAFISNNRVFLSGAVNGYSNLRLSYYARPSKLVATSTCRQVSSMSAGVSVTLSSALSSVPTGTEFDLVSNTSPYLFTAVNQTATVSSATYTFAVPDTVSVGDWLCPEGTSPVVQLPLDLHPVLVYKTVATILRLSNYPDAAESANAEAMALLTSMLGLVAPRLDGQSHVIAGSSPFVGSRGRSGRNYGGF